MRPMLALFLLMAALPVPLAAVAQSTPDDTMPLANSTWRVQDANGEPSGGSPFGLTFLADGTVLVTTGCPDAEGAYEAGEGGDIAIDLRDDTTAECDDAQAATFFSNLELANSYVVDEDGLLHLNLTDGFAYVFAPSLIGVTWQWVEFQSSNDTTTAPAEHEPHHVTFHQDGSVTIETPCATGTGSFLETADGFDLNLAAVDGSGCAQDSASALLLRDLEMVTSYLIRDGYLWVALPMDGGIHQFAPVYETEPTG